jgi:hypothetical protein
VERIVLHGIRTLQYVTSFRTARLSQAMLAELEGAKQVRTSLDGLGGSQVRAFSQTSARQVRSCIVVGGTDVEVGPVASSCSAGRLV